MIMSARRSVEALRELLMPKRHILCITGAGLSTESGIPDYRSPTGSYSKGHKPILHSEFVASEAARKRYWARSWLGFSAFQQARPNPGHLALAALEREGRVNLTLTQNVDGLHQAAGSRRVLELHGCLRDVTCLGCGVHAPREALQDALHFANAEWLKRHGLSVGVGGGRGGGGRDAAAAMRADGDADLKGIDTADFVVPSCACGGTLKPAVVFFGANAESAIVEAGMAAVQTADAILVAGDDGDSELRLSASGADHL